MRKALSAALILTICCTISGIAGTKWQFAKVFPDTNISFGSGVHGIAVDKIGKIWVGPFNRTNNDSLGSKGITAIYVYNPDGTEAAISRIKTIATAGRADTLISSGSIRGARADADGNVVISGYFNTGGDGASRGHYWRLNYETGAGMNHVGLSGSQIAPAFTSANEMFTGNVAPGNPIRIWASDFSALGNAIESTSGYSRTIEVSKDGNDIYQCGYDLQKIYKYHSGNGIPGPYTLIDSVAIGCQVESIGWNTKDGYLYFSSGNIDTLDYGPLPPAPYTATVWYAMDAVTKAIEDSIVWNWAAYPYNVDPVWNAPRPRGIAFSVTGDTAYVACYNHAKAAIQMFVRIQTSGEASWHNTLTASDGCSGTRALLFGTAAGGTPDLDPPLGEYELPPSPPSGVFDARFALPITPTVFSPRDYRADSVTSATWRITFQPGLCGYPIVFTWDSAAFSASGSFLLRDELGGTVVNVNMRAQKKHTLTVNGISSLLVVHTSDIVRDVHVAARWNLVSVPVKTLDSSVAVLYPGAISEAFGYANGYVAASTLSPGRGYWLKFGATDTFSLSGKTVRPMDVPVSAGWNIIGGYDADVTVAGITATPPGTIGSNFFGYDHGYVIPMKLIAGMGYWIRVTQAGVLNLGSGGTKVAGQIAAVDPGWIRVTLRDSAGHEGLLYLASGDPAAWKAELPPTPPAGIFDVRFAGDRYVVGAGEQHEVVMQSVEYPLSIQVTNLKGARLVISDGEGGVLVNGGMEEGRIVTIARGVKGLEIGVDTDVPTTFELNQNYPNPFNPVTTITFGLPEKQIVSLKVFDVLGREVSTILNSVELKAGHHRVQWDALKYATGVYFLRLQAGHYSEVRTMLLMK